MNRIITALLLGIFPIALPAQNFSGRYNGTYEGAPVALTLKSAGSIAFTGELNDSHNTFAVSANAQGNTLKGQCTETNLGLVMTLTGTLENDRLALSLTIGSTVLSLDLLKEGTMPAVTKTAPPAGKEQHDPALVGRWTKQSNYNSGYGQGYMSSESSMILLADGQMADGGSRTVVGGADWSGNSSSTGGAVIEGLYWYSDKQQIYLRATENGKTETQCLGNYYIEDGKMLITGQDGTKVLFYKG